MKNNGICFGADYYPEQWDRSMWEDDARRMKDMGISMVRMMEFAWIILEPSPGKYDFSLFDEAIDIFAGHGIKTVLGTPTATPPVWLHQKDPGMMQVYPDGTYKDFGSRRQGCFNSKTYFNASMKITEKIARHFSTNRNVVGWQVDNEVGHEGSDMCVCPQCVSAWHSWLRDRYGTVDRMNHTWGTEFWSTSYSRFSQVPVPRPQVSPDQNPGLILDYYRFMSDSAVRFVHSQVEILRKHAGPHQWVTTDLFNPSMTNAIDMEKLVEPMDFVGLNNYPVWGDQDEPLPYYFVSFALSYLKGLKERQHFTVFEQICGFQGHVCLGYLPPEGQVVQWTNQAVAHGAENIFYFRWRTASLGQEQLCYGLLDPDNSDTDRYLSLKKNIKENAGSFERIASTAMHPPACLVFDRDNALLVKDQYLSQGMVYEPTQYLQVGYELEAARHYAPYVLFNVNADVRSPGALDPDRYRVISLPLYQMADPDFAERMARWVEGGGNLILGWRTGTRDMENRAVDMELPGIFSDMAGLKVKRFESLNRTKVRIRAGLVPAKGEVWADIIEPVTARPMAIYTDRKKHYRGSPAVTVNSFGRGRVYYLGTSPDPVGLFALYRKIFRKAGVKPRFHGMGIEVVHRTGDDGRGMDVVLNHTGRTRLFRGGVLRPWEMKIIENG